MPAETLPAPLQVALTVGHAFDSLGIGYFLGGSLASSIQGEPRATNDIDFVVDLRAEQVAALEAALGPDFDVDAESLREAARRRSSWNIFHLPSATKVDLFIKRDSDFDQSEFSRRQQVELFPGESLSVKSPEDTVLRKLLWFRQGGETSSTQWRDIVQVLRVSGASLDRGYLQDWALRLAVDELLTRALTNASSY
ncbi:MAG: hypothetical protein L0Y66_18835 [Myxococcaceae bacterium]|nr:hypothetical protein [Myxococcaceae bacterium]MCI0671392.1 hypothetical protein [Myxococcaceae bacterium]